MFNAMSSVILDHNDPARVACDSSAQITGLATLEAIVDARLALEMQAELDRAVRSGAVFDKFLDKLIGGPSP